MAKRPIFLPDIESENNFVKIINIEFQWTPGIAFSQQQKNVKSIVENAKREYNLNILEVSSKSMDPNGKKLSAFNLALNLEKLDIKFDHKFITVESAYQGSKVFEDGGPYIEIYKKGSSEAKKEIATQNDSVLLAFDFFGDKWPNKPYTAFYNWLYINALNQQNNIIKTLMNFDGYSDISFNPNKSINCQAYSCALYVALFKREILQDVISDKNKFLELMKKIEKIYYKSVNKIEKKENNRQGLF
ncbi:MAG: hypothetical protein KBA47_03105 [Caldisericia bacterium]|nr:hypothetical protein [Caldisericia bacterium]HQJ40787.1 hypothetical protein [Exilispira sp.]